MNRPVSAGFSVMPCVPRTRGDEPYDDRARRCYNDAFPAHAGMNRHHIATTATISGVPRTRGDEPADGGWTVPIWKRSPHTRG